MSVKNNHQCIYGANLTSARNAPLVMVTSTKGDFKCIDLRAKKVCLHAQIAHGGVTAVECCNKSSFQYVFGDRRGAIGMFDIRKCNAEMNSMFTAEERYNTQDYTADRTIYDLSHHERMPILASACGNKMLGVLKY